MNGPFIFLRPQHRLDIRRRGAELHMRLWWRTGVFTAVAVFSGVVAITGAGAIAIFPAEARIIGFVVLIISIPLAYWALRAAINRTDLLLTRDSLTVIHGPVPPAARHVIPIAEIQQIEVRVRHVLRRPATRLLLVRSDGTRGWITRWIMDDRTDVARRIERAIERRLGLDNRPMVCTTCGYDLRSTRRRCPECGTSLRSMRTRIHS